MTLHLDQFWYPTPEDPNGTLTIRLHNLGDAPVAAQTFCYSCQVYPGADATVTGGTLIRTFGTHTELAIEAPLSAGGFTEVSISGLAFCPRNRSQGIMAAWLETDEGPLEIKVSDLIPPADTDVAPIKPWPAGSIDLPLALTPWPAAIEVPTFTDAAPLAPEDPAQRPAFAEIAALHGRLFPATPSPFTLAETPGARVVRIVPDRGPPAGGYRLTFRKAITLHHSDEAGLRNGLITLAHLAHGARTDPRMAFPGMGEIIDTPRFDWRGCHFDVARNFHGRCTVQRLLDVLAWLKMNRLHWHLTDDEGWRLPSKAFPDLMAPRGIGHPIPPQYADGPGGQQGHYTPDDIAQVLERGTALGITVMPEIDMPGHATALLTQVPGLRDPGETPDSYRSIQNFPNNALNPSLPKTYEVTATLLAECAALFPDAPIHIGADEVDPASWSASPLAQALAEAEDLNGTQELQAYFLRQAQTMVRALGRTVAGWDECADGGGIAPEGTLLFAWRSVEKTAELIARGYDVVATPGQAFYLDMAQGEGWDAPGATWAGIATPETCYTLDPEHGLPPGPGRLVGVQAGLWTEHLNSVPKINDMAFPRLAAVAETAWTPAAQKDWPRFAALSRLVPKL